MEEMNKKKTKNLILIIVLLAVITAVFAVSYVVYNKAVKNTKQEQLEQKEKEEKERQKQAQLQQQEEQENNEITEKQENKEFDFKGKILESNKINIVSYYADWCGPCQDLKPTIKELEEEFKDNEEVNVHRINVDYNRELLVEQAIPGFPTTIIYKNGKEAKRFMGVVPKETFIQAVKEIK